MLTTLAIEFGGWFMCRLATDPDPTDERRGVSGSTFAYGHEPDLDRVIRLHAPPELIRSHCPAVGVHVRRASLGACALAELVGARVDLLGNPRFENRNFVLTMAGREPIVPFHLEISGEGFHLRRRVKLGDAQAPVCSIPRAALQRYGARGFYTATEKIRAANGITDPLQNRIERRNRLLADLELERDPLQREILRRRVRELQIAIEDPSNERMVVMRAIEEFRFDLTGEVELSPDLPVAGRPAVDEPWSIDFWMGGWDPDAMSGYMGGTLNVPFLAEEA